MATMTAAPNTIIVKLRARSSMLRTNELATMLTLSRRSIERMVAAGVIPHTRVRHTVRFDPQQIATWLEEHSV